MLVNQRSVVAAGERQQTPVRAGRPFIQPNVLHVRYLSFAFDRWPGAAGTLRVAFVTDLHVGCPEVSLDRAAEIVSLVNAERPDLTLLGGDYMSGPRYVRGGRVVPPEEIARPLSGLEAPLGVFSVLGNHDWYYDGRRVWRALEAAGIPVLENSSVPLKNGPRIWLTGLADSKTRDPDLDAALAEVPDEEPCLVVAHDPAAFAGIDRRPLLTLCGHTHAGQIRLPWIGALRNASKAPLRWSYGHIVEDGRHMFVSAGIGSSLLPIRFNAPPEFLIIEIESSRTGQR